MINLDNIKTKLDKDKKFWIAFVGDSITSCEWVHPNWREIIGYVLSEKLKYDWGLRFFNFGYDGATSKDILEKVDIINSVNPDLVIYMIGANDPFLGVDVSSHIENIKKFKKKIKAQVIISTDNKPWNDVAVEKYLPYVIEDRKEFTESFVDLFKESDNFPKERIYTFLSEEILIENIKEGDLDYWHPNQLGNAYIAKVILDQVFGISFDPERYIKTTLEGLKLPEY